MEPIIHALNYKQFVADPVIDGQKKKRGLIPRDYKKYPVGCYGAALPYHAVDFPLIPRSEWAERIKDMEAQKSRLSDIILDKQVPCTDQGNRGYCHTADTEVLTERGWVAWPDYNYSDLVATVNPLTHAMEYQAPFERHVYEYDGEMVYCTNRRLDFGVTPDHRMLLRKWDESARTLSDRYAFQRAADIGWYAGVMHAPRGWLGTELLKLEVPGDRSYDGDDFIALLSLIVSDGFAASYEHSGDLVSFASFRPECRERVAALAARVGFREQPSRPGVWNRWGAGALARWLFANCYTGGGFKAQHKKVPDIVKVASRRQVELFLTWNGDQNHGRAAHGEHYYSASKRMIDDLQELCLRVGRRGTITNRGPRTGTMPQGIVSTSRESWELVVSQRENLCIERKKNIERDHYKGLVYCAAVPNGTLVTRRNGSVLISGNCWIHSGTGALMALRASMNQPTVALSAYAGACIIKNYRDEGGWGAQGLDFIMSRGIPSEEFWPQRSVDRSNDNPQTWADAAKYKVTEGFIDLAAAQYDRNMSFEQEGTCLLICIPVIKDENWWGHSIYGCDLVNGVSLRSTMRAESGKLFTLRQFDKIWDVDGVGAGFGVRIRNSWGSRWGDNGFGILAGSKAISDGATAPRAALAA